MIEAADAEQAAELAALHARAFDRPWTETEIAKLLQSPTAFALVWRTDAGAQGFVIAWAAAGDSELLTVAVVPEARRRGVGASLVAAAGAAALLRGAAAMHLEVAENNAAARALYAKLGYEESGRRHGYYVADGGRVDAIVMRRNLPRPAV